jgi:hypothetical protein
MPPVGHSLCFPQTGTSKASFSIKAHYEWLKPLSPARVVVLEQLSCSILIAMYEMHGQLIIVSATTATQSNLKNLGSPTQSVTEPLI